MSGRRFSLMVASFLVSLLFFFLYRTVMIRYVPDDILKDQTSTDYVITKGIPGLFDETNDTNNHLLSPELEKQKVFNGLDITAYLPHLHYIFTDKNDWRAKTANLVTTKNRNIFLLFKTVDITSNGRTIKLNSCNIIILPEDKTLSIEERAAQAIVFETTGITQLTFSQPVEMEKGQGLDFASFEEGNLEGMVRIHSKGKTDSVEDDFLLQTRGLSFKSDQIVANGDVDFVFGRYQGAGRGLTIDLNMPITANKSVPEQVKDEDVLVTIQREGNLGGGVSLERVFLSYLERLQFQLDAKKISSTLTKGEKEDSTKTKSDSELSKEAKEDEKETLTVEITCQKGLSLNPNPDQIAGWLARFMEEVEVHVFHKDEKNDLLKCRNLYLYFLDRQLEKSLAVPENKAYYTSLKKKPTGRLNKVETVMLKAVRSESAPAHLEAPRYSFEAEGDVFICDLTDNSFVLTATEGTRRVRLTREKVSIYASFVRYERGLGGSWGTVVAGQNGMMDAIFEERGKPIRLKSTWFDGLKVSPEPENPSLIRVAMNGGITFNLEGTGNVIAEEADFWLVPLHGKSVLKANPDTSPLGKLEAFQPHSAQFRGNIQMHCPSGSGLIRNTMNFRFLQENASAAVPSSSSMVGTGSGTTSNNQKNSTFFGDSRKQFTMEASQLDLWILLRDKEVVVNRLNLQDKVLFREISPTEPGEEPLKIEGDMLVLQEPQTEKTVVELTGKTASFFGRGLNLLGNTIILNRGQNFFTVLGPGKLCLNITDKKKEVTKEVNRTAGKETTNGAKTTRETAKNGASNSDATSQGKQELKISGPMEISWSKKLYFDGQTLTFQATEQNPLLVSHSTHLLRCPEIRLSLKKPIRLFDKDLTQNNDILNDLALIECFGTSSRPVLISAFMENHGNEAQKVQSVTCQGEVQSFLLEYETKDFSAKGPGWLRTTAKTPPPAKDKKNSDNDADKLNSTTILSADKGFERKPWGHLHLVFQESLSGNINQRQASFLRRVQTVYCETDQPETDLDVRKPDTFPKQVVTLDCNELQILMPPGATQQGDNLELRAKGNILFRYASIVGNGDSVIYSNDKKKVYLKGDSISPASLHKQDYPGAEIISLGRFQSGSYNLTNGRLEVEAYSNAN